MTSNWPHFGFKLKSPIIIHLTRPCNHQFFKKFSPKIFSVRFEISKKKLHGWRHVNNVMSTTRRMREVWKYFQKFRKLLFFDNSIIQKCFQLGAEIKAFLIKQDLFLNSRKSWLKFRKIKFQWFGGFFLKRYLIEPLLTWTFLR